MSQRRRPANTARAQFAALVQQPEEQWNLDRAALLIAREAYPDLSVEQYLRRLDALAEATRECLPSAAGGAAPARDDVLLAVREVLVEQEGFGGNEEDYHDPRNSFLNEVLDRRVGLPITLSLVYMEVSRRLGVPAQGIGLPGHFIVGWPPDRPSGETRYLDPFHGGRELTVDDCGELFREMFGTDISFSEDLLQAVSKRALIARILRNLKLRYVGEQQFRLALDAVERILLVEPVAAEVRDRGVILAHMGQLSAAWSDLQAYVRAAPDHPDAEQVRELADRIWRNLGRMN